MIDLDVAIGISEQFKLSLVTKNVRLKLSNVNLGHVRRKDNIPRRTSAQILRHPLVSSEYIVPFLNMILIQVLVKVLNFHLKSLYVRYMLIAWNKRDEDI